VTCSSKPLPSSHPPGRAASPHVVNQLTSVDDVTLIEGALEAMAVLGGAWAAEHGVTVQVAARDFLDGLQATE
jgi:hypothetical protein